MTTQRVSVLEDLARELRGYSAPFDQHLNLHAEISGLPNAQECSNYANWEALISNLVRVADLLTTDTINDKVRQYSACLWGPLKFCITAAVGRTAELYCLLQVYDEAFSLFPRLALLGSQETSILDIYPETPSLLKYYLWEICQLHKLAVGIFSRPKWWVLFTWTWKGLGEDASPVLERLQILNEAYEAGRARFHRQHHFLGTSSPVWGEVNTPYQHHPHQEQQRGLISGQGAAVSTHSAGSTGTTTGSTASGTTTGSTASGSGLSSAPKPIRQRIRMLTSCLECRRRKLKCDKSVPCTTCLRFAWDCQYLGRKLDGASQLRLTENREKVEASLDEARQTLSSIRSLETSSLILSLEDAIIDSGRSLPGGNGVNSFKPTSAIDKIRIIFEYLGESPEGYKRNKEYLSLYRQRHKASGDWVLQHPVLRSWLYGTPDDTPKARVVYLEAVPGSGKSFLTSTIINKFEATGLFTPRHRRCVLSFQCIQQLDGSPSVDPWHRLRSSLLAQLARRDPSVLEFVYQQRKAQTHSETSGQLLRQSNIDLEWLLDQALESQQEVIVTLDDVHHFRHLDIWDWVNRATDNGRLVPYGNHDPTATRIRFLLSGRHNNELNHRLKSYHLIELGNVGTHKRDIELYVRDKVDELGSRYSINPSLLEDLAKGISQRANGMFLYARVIVENLLNQQSIGAVTTAISDETVPSELTDLYQFPPRRSIGRDLVLAFLLCAGRPMHRRELECLLETNLADETINPLPLPASRESLKQTCGDFITIGETPTVWKSEQINAGISQQWQMDDPDDLVCISNHVARAQLLLQWSPFPMLKAHAKVALFCARYLNGQPFRATSTTDMRHLAGTGYYALLDYTIQFFPRHLNAATGLQVATGNEGGISPVLQGQLLVAASSRGIEQQLPVGQIRAAIELFLEDQDFKHRPTPVTRLYGRLPFKCGKPECPLFFYPGFASREERDEHMLTQHNQHDQHDREIFLDQNGGSGSPQPSTNEDKRDAGRGNGIGIPQPPRHQPSHFHPSIRSMRSLDDDQSDIKSIGESYSLWSDKLTATTNSSNPPLSVSNSEETSSGPKPETLTFYNYTGSEPERPDDEIQSIVSAPDDIGSVSSSFVGFTHRQAAVEYFVSGLISDPDLLPLYQEALKKIDEPRFIRNNRRLLKTFFLNLHPEGKTASQKLAMRFLRSRMERTRISAQIVRLVGPTHGSTLRATIDFALAQKKDSFLLLNLLLDQRDELDPSLSDQSMPTDSGDKMLTFGFEDPETGDDPGSDWEIDSSTDEESTADAEGEDELAKLRSTAGFLTGGRAYTIYKQGLQEFVRPGSTAVDSYTGSPQSADIGETPNSGLQDSSIGGTTGAETPPDDNFMVDHIHNHLRWLARALNVKFKLLDWILGYSRPMLKPGYRRVEWQCDCRSMLYADFPNAEEDREMLDNLEQSLQSTQPQPYSPVTHQPPSPASTLVSSSSSIPQQSSPSTPGNASSNIAGAPLKEPAVSISKGAKSNKASPSAQKPKYLALCVNTGDGYTTIAELDATDLQSDAICFLKMKEAYIKARGIRWGLRFLVKPRNVEFVQFTLWHLKEGYVSVFERPNSIPPPSAHQYEYLPRPLRNPPPMPPQVFIHYLQHGEGDLSLLRNDWLPRLPKRLHSRVIDGAVSDCGWGVHVLEGPNREVVFWIMVATIGAGALTSILYSALMQDVQGGASIGALIVALPPAFMAAFLFRLGAV